MVTQEGVVSVASVVWISAATSGDLTLSSRTSLTLTGYLLPAVSTVIASEGVSGIPEAAMIESRDRGVLDAPLSRSMTVRV